MSIEIRTCKAKEFAAGISPIWQYFGVEPSEGLHSNFRRILPANRIHAAFDGKEVVGSTSSYPFEMTIPGGPVPVAGITLVGVRPTHRRQGILSKLIKQLLEKAQERGEAIGGALGGGRDDLRPFRLRHGFDKRRDPHRSRAH